MSRFICSLLLCCQYGIATIFREQNQIMSALIHFLSIVNSIFMYIFMLQFECKIFILCCNLTHFSWSTLLPYKLKSAVHLEWDNSQRPTCFKKKKLVGFKFLTFYLLYEFSTSKGKINGIFLLFFYCSEELDDFHFHPCFLISE